MLGAGMAVAIFVDATFVRAVLVPALMRLAGRANWWAPTWLRRVHARFGFSEGR
jgi:putative drug exporter of the RND superfamily